MNFTVIRGAVCALAVCLSLQAWAEERCLDAGTSNRNADESVRKLTLSIGQSASSVSGDPALLDIVDLVAFEKGVAVYVNQPFDLTYKDMGLAFNVPRTHTLWMTSSDKKLTAIGIETCPLFENDFEGALKVLKQWQVRFDEMKLEKIGSHRGYPPAEIQSLGERFASAKFPKFGQDVGIWKQGNVYVTLGLSRVEREYFDVSANEVRAGAYVYKVWINLLDEKKFNSR